MKLIETKTYQIEMSNEEEKEIKNISSILNEIACQFLNKDVSYTDYNGDICELDTSHFEYVLEFLDALVTYDVTIY